MTSNATLKNLPVTNSPINEGRVYADSMDLIFHVGYLYPSKETFEAGYPSIGSYKLAGWGEDDQPFYFATINGSTKGLEIGAEVQS